MLSECASILHCPCGRADEPSFLQWLHITKTALLKSNHVDQVLQVRSITFLCELSFSQERTLVGKRAPCGDGTHDHVLTKRMLCELS